MVRWHLKAIDPRFNGEMLDSDVIAYLRSIGEEIEGRELVPSGTQSRTGIQEEI